MADEDNTGEKPVTTDAPTANGSGAANGTDQRGVGPIQARVLTQFIRDLSFEVPSVDRLLKRPGDNPNMGIEINVSAQHLEDARFESAIEFTANA
ncbi:MAG: protein-export chaperone SecB, partial [Pseudomonadota bacterium]